MARLEESGGARLRHDEEGRPYWSLWGAGWKEGEDMDAGEPMTFAPDSFPPGTQILILEPPPGDPRSEKFYRDLLEKQAGTKGR